MSLGNKDFLTLDLILILKMGSIEMDASKLSIKKLSKWNIVLFIFGIGFIASSIGIHFFAQYKIKQEVIQVNKVP